MYFSLFHSFIHSQYKHHVLLLLYIKEKDRVNGRGREQIKKNRLNMLQEINVM